VLLVASQFQRRWGAWRGEAALGAAPHPRARMRPRLEGGESAGGCKATGVAAQPAFLGVDEGEAGKRPPAGVGVFLCGRGWGAVGHVLPRVWE